MTPKVKQVLVPFPEAYCNPKLAAKLSAELEQHLSEPPQASGAVRQDLGKYDWTDLRNLVRRQEDTIAELRSCIADLTNWCNSVLEDEGWDASTRNAAGIALRKIKGDHE